MDGIYMSFQELLDARSEPSKKYDQYYEGEVSLDALGISLPPEARILEMAAPFPKLAVDVLAESLNPEGYRIGDNAELPKTLHRYWQVNNLNTTVKLAIVEALVQGIAYFVVGNRGGGSDVPLVTAHGPREISVRYDHVGQIAEAVHVYNDGITEGAVHYLPGRNDFYRKDPASGIWKQNGRSQATGADRPAIVAMINKARLKDTFGRSEIKEIIKTTDAASRSLTNLQVAQELLAMPTRYLFGEGLGKMKDQNGNPIDKIAAYFGQFITGPEGSTAGQIPGADLQQIINTYKLYAQVISSITGIPPSMLGISTDNPSSADAMRVAKDRLIAKAEVKQAMFGDALEDLAKLMLQIGGITDDADVIEVQWRDPALSSASAKSANLLQAHAQGVVGAETARDGLQLTPEQKRREDARSTDFARRDAQMGAA
jgi:hypothetical protein